MPSSRISLGDLLPDFGENDPEPSVIETGGEVFPDGKCLELVKSNDNGLRLLESGSNKTSEIFQRANRTFGSPDLQPSLLELLTLPTGRAPSGSTADLFKTIQDLFNEYGFSNEAAKLFAYYVLSNWFSGLLPVAPCLVITGSRPEANIALQILSLLVRHGLLLGDINLATFRCLPMHIQPTLLVGQLHPSMYRAVATSTYLYANILCKDGVINLSCAKIVYAGTKVSNNLSGEPILRINLPPFHGKLQAIDPASRERIVAHFQPRLVDYRLHHAVQVRDSEFDIPTLPSNLRILARALCSSLIDAPDLQAEIISLLEDQKEAAHARRWIDPECVAIEAALEYCHDQQGPTRVGVGELADKASAILASRGEETVVKPKEMGNQLRILGFPLKRDSQGYAIHLNEILRLQVHVLARNYKVAAAEQVVTNCSKCTEILTAGV